MIYKIYQNVLLFFNLLQAGFSQQNLQNFIERAKVIKSFHFCQK